MFRILYTVVFLFVTILIAKLSGVLQYALSTTAQGEPTIKKGGALFMSNLLPYKKYKILVFKQTNPKYDLANYAQRLVAVEGDVLQIKNGDLYVNDSLISGFPIKQAYKIDGGFANFLYGKGFSEEDLYQTSDNQYITQLSKSDLRNEFSYERFLNTQRNPSIIAAYKRNWSIDNFGPLRIPPGKTFFLGDNRNISLDSRYMGFVDHKDIIGAVFFPKN